MNNFQRRYKKKPLGFTDANDGRLVRTVKHEERRRVHRAENFSRHRGVDETQEIAEPSPTSDTVAKLRRWKAERDIRRKIESLKKKPAFKVGAVHHKFYSPPVSGKIVVKEAPCHPRGAHKVKHHPTPEKRITRATQKRLDAKLTGATLTPAKPGDFRSRANRAKPARKKLRSMTKESKYSFAPENYEFKPPAGLAEIPLFGRFVIPKNADVRLSWNNRAELGRRDDREKPMQMMQEMLSLVSLEAPAPDNSSVKSFARKLSSDDENPEATDLKKAGNVASELDLSDVEVQSIAPKLSSEDGSLGKIDVSKNPAKELDFPDSEIKADAAKFEAITGETDLTTPPRSGTPVPASFSPYIVSSRGKLSARKEQKLKMGIRRSSPDDVPTKDTVMQSLNISVEEEERTAQYFKFILQREIERLTELCDKWEAVMNETDLTDDARYRINQAVGQTNLLIRKKFERFRRLVADCETGKGEMLVQCRDLQGFWDMMYMEVKDCETRFLRLDFLRSRGWIEEPQIPVASRKATRTRVAPAKPKIGAKSSARSWIIAARKNKVSLESDDPVRFPITVKTTETETSPSRAASPSPRGKNSRRSLRKSPSSEASKERITPTSLLKKVQLSEASKTVKTPEVKLDDSITYVNSDQTPGKGILKKSDESPDQKSCSPKSGRKVDFNHVYLDEFPVENDEYEALQNSIDLGKALARIDAYGDDDPADEAFNPEHSDEDAEDEALQNSIDLGRALARIDAYDANNRDEMTHDLMEHFPSVVEKRLDFEDNSSDETETREIAEAVVTVNPRLTKTRVKRSTRSSKRFSTRLFASNLVEASLEETGTDETLADGRVLRNRTVATEAQVKISRRGAKSSAIDEQSFSVSLSAKENSDPGREGEKTTTSETVEDPAKRRRTARKSARFNADDRAASASNKSALQKKPHSRRSRKISLLGTSSRDSVLPAISGDLMSFDSP